MEADKQSGHATALAVHHPSSISRFLRLNRWTKYAVFVPVIMSAVLWFVSLETRLREFGERLTNISARQTEHDRSLHDLWTAEYDPRPKPQARTEFEGIHATLKERSERLNSFEDRLNKLQAQVNDPKGKPETVVELEYIRQMLRERGERLTSLEERLNKLQMTVDDPKGKPETVVELKEIREVLRDHAEKDAKTEARLNEINAFLLNYFAQQKGQLPALKR